MLRVGNSVVGHSVSTKENCTKFQLIEIWYSYHWKKNHIVANLKTCTKFEKKLRLRKVFDVDTVDYSLKAVYHKWVKNAIQDRKH